MIIKNLIIKNFRNYTYLDLDFNPYINIFIGSNGQGKTNILESIYMMSCARSHRTSKDIDLINKNKNAYQINISFYDEIEKNNSDPQILDLKYINNAEGLAELENKEYFNNKDFYKKLYSKYSNKKRHILHNDIEINKISEFCGLFNSVIFAPEDLLMIKEGPSTRRRFLDILISQINKKYFLELQELQNILINRNALLKKIKEKDNEKFNNTKNILNRSDLADLKNNVDLYRLNLEVWNKKFVKTAISIIKERKKIIKEIEKYAQEFHSLMSNNKEELTIKYKTIFSIEDNDDDRILEEKFLNKLKKEEKDDIIRGNTNSGPQRDDIEFFINNMSLKLYGSQGQQRSAVLSLKIAELKLIENKLKKKPVLLLDDVMSELDPNRRLALIKSVNDMQVFITCTDLLQLSKDWNSIFEISSDKRTIFEVNDANVKIIKHIE